MLYPVYVHLGDENYAHGVTIPDFSGCFSLPNAIQEAIHLVYMVKGEDVRHLSQEELERKIKE